MFSKSCCNARSQRITDRKKKAIEDHIVIVVSGKTLSEVFFLELDNISFYLLAKKLLSCSFQYSTASFGGFTANMGSSRAAGGTAAVCGNKM